MLQLFDTLPQPDLDAIKSTLHSKLQLIRGKEFNESKLQQLPIFYTQHNGALKRVGFDSTLHLPHKLFHDFCLVDSNAMLGPFVITDNNSDYELAQAMGYTPQTGEDFMKTFLTSILAPEFDVASRNEFIFYILDNLHSKSIAPLSQMLRDLNFIPTTCRDGKVVLATPTSLFHPLECDAASDLLQIEFCYPGDSLTDFSSRLQCLKELGLKMQYSPAELTAVVNQLDQQPSSELSHQRAKILLDLFSNKSYLHDMYQPVFNLMQNKRCIPTLQCPKEYLNTHSYTFFRGYLFDNSNISTKCLEKIYWQLRNTKVCLHV